MTGTIQALDQGCTEVVMMGQESSSVQTLQGARQNRWIGGLAHQLIISPAWVLWAQVTLMFGMGRSAVVQA
jgi:hypothetical protein